MKYEPYIPTTDEKVLGIVEKAFKTNAQRDRSDRESGFAAPGDTGLAGLLRNAICAILSGIRGRSQGDLDCIAEGLAMVIKAEVLARSLEDYIQHPRRIKE
jgi:hypothetical protein